jgi:hypothetical protein
MPDLSKEHGGAADDPNPGRELPEGLRGGPPTLDAPSPRGHDVPAMAIECAETRYYDLDGSAIVWEPGRIPRLVETGTVVYDIVRFMGYGRRISKIEFEKLVTRMRGKRPS